MFLRITSARTHSRPPSASASADTRSSERAASTGRTPWATRRSAISLPVYPVAPKTTIREAIAAQATRRRIV